MNIHIYIYAYICMCVCVYMHIYIYSMLRARRGEFRGVAAEVMDCINVSAAEDAGHVPLYIMCVCVCVYVYIR